MDGWTLAVAILALLVAAATGFYNRRSATAAERSEKIALEAKDAAEKVARAEVDRDHEAYAPPMTGSFVIEGRISEGGVNEGGILFYEFTLPRAYEMRARTSAQGGAVVNFPQVTMRSVDRVWRVEVDRVAGKAWATNWDTLTISFWPAASQVDQPEPWVCRCGRDGKVADRPGHWQWDVGIPQSRDGVLVRPA